MLRSRWAGARRRRGVVLLVVLCLLTLFLIVGLTFVFYANACQQAARLGLEAESRDRPDADPELLASYFLGQLIYDAVDDESGIYSGLRGHSLGRNMFGGNYHITRTGQLLRNARGELVDAAGNVLNDVPFNGTGRPKNYDPRLPFRLPANSPAKDD